MSVPVPTMDSAEPAGRSSILDCACELFAANGFAGTSMRSLARAAKTSQALIHHHFGTKSALYRAVRGRLMDRLADAEVLTPTHVGADLDPTAQLAGGMARYADFLEANPEFLRLATWARLEGDNEPWANYEALLAPMENALNALKEAGMLRADLDVSLHMAMVGGIVEHWVAHRAMHVASFAPEEGLSELTQRYFAQAASVIAHGASARPEPS
ncbi:MAG: TetR/AcrR family transcriptional regulator [Deltaproteobacteria bacterium]|nr:TetR/AcrR family transcriptional regulator [Deltaproteobacteria bacterium]